MYIVLKMIGNTSFAVLRSFIFIHGVEEKWGILMLTWPKYRAYPLKFKEQVKTREKTTKEKQNGRLD